VTLGFIAGGPVLGPIVKYLIDIEGKTLHQKVRERMPSIEVNPDVYLVPDTRTFTGTGTWKYVDPVHIAMLEATPRKGDPGKITLAISIQDSGQVGVEVKGGMDGKIVTVEGGPTLNATTTTSSTVTYEIAVQAWTDVLDLPQKS
jgi:hypothetical protein